MPCERDRRWTLSTEGTASDLKALLVELEGEEAVVPAFAASVEPAALPALPQLDKPDWLSGIPRPYSWRDIAPFSPSSAVYFMDGYSDARIRLRESEEEILLQFWDKNTSIAASAPTVFAAGQEEVDHFTAVPPPLQPLARFPENTPDRYKRTTTYHALQVISMNMKAKDSDARLLIGLPYAEKYPELFFRTDIFGIDRRDESAASYGVVQSLTEFNESGGHKSPYTNGFPARSFFAIYHLIETPIGALFNKKATQMELQPSTDGKLALKLPPLPFNYSLINGPIPLFSVDEPDGQPIADLLAAHHNDQAAATVPTRDAWPWHGPSLEAIEPAIASARRRGND